MKYEFKINYYRYFFLYVNKSWEGRGGVMGEDLIEMVTEAIMYRIPELVIAYHKLRITDKILLEDGVIQQISDQRVSRTRSELREQFLQIYEHMLVQLMSGSFPVCVISWEIHDPITMTMDIIINLFKDEDIHAISVLCLMPGKWHTEIAFICHDSKSAQVLSHEPHIRLIPFQNNKVIEVRSITHIDTMLVTTINVWRSIKNMLHSITLNFR